MKRVTEDAAFVAGCNKNKKKYSGFETELFDWDTISLTQRRDCFAKAKRNNAIMLFNSVLSFYAVSDV